ncbi:MAG: DNA mismatch repair endonuclease MutL [Candidatus Auribacterota bacterium]
MGKIKILDDNVINKIAAGEVVENPSSVLKELMENSIDAESTRIDVSIEKSGMKMIRVADNGCGMPRDDAAIAIERHATSKLRLDSDLYSLSTMGFRGEALPSIAAVSQFTIRTAPAGDLVGTQIRIEGGKIVSLRDDTISPGTIIEVENLFYNVPARKKFIRSYHAEKLALSQTFLKIALAYPDITFVLTDDDKEMYHLVSVDKIRDRISAVFGADFCADLIPFSYQSPDLSIYGYTSHPQLCRNTRSGQYVYVNNRAVQSYQISQALQRAYGSLLPHGRFPICFIYVDIVPQQVDVNVHPTKKEVKFTDPNKIQDIIKRSIDDVLKKSKLLFDIKEQDDELKKINLSYNIPRFKAMQTDQIKADTSSQESTYHQNSAPGAVPVKKIFPADTDSNDPFMRHLDEILHLVDDVTNDVIEPIEEESIATHSEGEIPELNISVDPGKLSGIRVIGQIGKLFIVGENKDGLVLIDQHAAHERINYERIMNAMLRDEHISQSLLFPVTYKTDPFRKNMILSKIDMLRKAGISIADFGPETLLIESLPVFISTTSAVAVLDDIAEEIKRSSSCSIENWQNKLAALLACRSSVKAADSLELAEMQQLIDDLHQTETPYTCPHGRPTIIRMTYEQLRKHFKRE